MKDHSMFHFQISNCESINFCSYLLRFMLAWVFHGKDLDYLRVSSAAFSCRH